MTIKRLSRVKKEAGGMLRLGAGLNAEAGDLGLEVRGGVKA